MRSRFRHDVIYNFYSNMNSLLSGVCEARHENQKEQNRDPDISSDPRFGRLIPGLIPLLSRVRPCTRRTLQNLSKDFIMTTTASNALYIFDCGVRETRMQFYRTFREPKLYRYAKKFEYDKIVERCTSNPKAAAREAKFRHDYPPQQTPLHLVLEPLFLMGNPAIVNDEMREKRHSAAAALLEANRNAALMCCTLGTTPITMVCVDPYASLKDVDMLIRVSPKSLLIPDIEGRLPLHYACINNRSNLEMFKMLLTACPEAAFAKDKLNRLPLHYAVMASPLSSQASGLDMLAGFLMEHSSKAPTSTVPAVELMIQANKKGAAASDGEGMTPLFHLCHYMNSPNADLTDGTVCRLGSACASQSQCCETTSWQRSYSTCNA